ncbi:hypothetical protein BSL78_01546 [Apostichopus japonicus]|uniref:Uncharacterized protein n=1 Tax=Stichopus japonicus TaxID=307972 RepID=A0A2G8LMP8_STIJA|nr:hypothetical protein BSL78_01546 [Apostichopus japonicus]
MQERVTKIVKQTSDRMTPTVHFTNRRTQSTESLVAEEELENEDNPEVTLKDSTVEIVISEVDQGGHTDNDGHKDDESTDNTEKKNITFWSILKWLRKNLRLRKWFGRGLLAFGQGFMYTSPMSATVVVAQGMNTRNHIYKGSSGATTHYF